MRLKPPAVAAAVAVSCAACIATIHPIYTDADLRFDPNLLGEWASDENDAYAVITRADSLSYHIEYTEENGVTVGFRGYLADVNGRLLLDLVQDDAAFPLDAEVMAIPVRLFVELRLDGQRAEEWVFDPDSAKAYLPYIHVDGEDYLTATTEELRDAIARPGFMAEVDGWTRAERKR